MSESNFSVKKWPSETVTLKGNADVFLCMRLHFRRRDEKGRKNSHFWCFHKRGLVSFIGSEGKKWRYVKLPPCKGEWQAFFPLLLRFFWHECGIYLRQATKVEHSVLSCCQSHIQRGWSKQSLSCARFCLGHWWVNFSFLPILTSWIICPVKNDTAKGVCIKS